MPTTKAHKTRHHSNLRPKHRQTKDYLQTYWPYLPLLSILLILVALLQPWHQAKPNSDVLPYATSVSVQALFNETNQKRSGDGKKQLKLDNELVAAAQAKADDMAKRNYWSHNTPDGQAPWSFISKAGYAYQKAGENLAYGFLTSQQVVSGWMNSASHRANILDSQYKEVGFGFADSANFDSNGPATVVVAMYGTPLDTATDQQELTPTNVTPAQASLTTIGNFADAPAPISISKIQSLTNGIAPWLQYVMGFIMGAAIMYLLIKHSLGVKRVIKNGEKFIIQHPLLDATLIAIVILCALMVQRIGTIL